MTMKNETLFTKIPHRQSVKILYQNLGGKWYAFADVNGEAYFAPLDFITPVHSRSISFKEEETLSAKETHSKLQEA
ncbi:hypothetical protein GW916_11865 [bacterium]|nr:hypothetical protein [bacterium]